MPESWNVKIAKSRSESKKKEFKYLENYVLMKNYVRKEKILQTIVLRKINCVASKNVFVTFLFILSWKL